MLVFVYGTLKRYHANHSFLHEQGFLGMAMTHPLYRLYDLGGYPGMVLDEAACISVHGEVWEVDAESLAKLDELEDITGGEYVREVIPLLPPFNQHRVEGYRYLRSVAGCRDVGASW